MITPYDSDYKETKRIKVGDGQIKADFIELRDWIRRKFGIEVLNIIYDLIDKTERRPRLKIVFDYHRDYLKFFENSDENSHSDRQKIIAEKFDEIVNNKTADLNYNTKNIWIVFTSFEPIAREEANSNIPSSDIENLKKELGNEDLWEISRAFSSTTFFVYTDKQLQEYKDSETIKLWAEKYFDLLDKHDQFRYFKRANFSIHLDSKENFDKNYSSNWFYYYK